MIHTPHVYKKKFLALAIGCVVLAPAVYAQTTVVADKEPESKEDGAILEEIVVYGVRASQAKSIDIKRDAANIVDSIVAEDIGKLPDTTITDSLQRITGVQIRREANEGTSLNVRGMPQVLTTLNGEQFLSPWTITEVGANFGDIPAGMITGADVHKSMSARILEGGISGAVDLKTINPTTLDEGLTTTLRMESSQGSRSDKEIKVDGTYGDRNPDHNISLFMGYNFDSRFGATLGLFNSSSYAANYQMWEELRLGFLDTIGGTPGDRRDLNNDGDLVNDWYIVPQEFGVRSNFMERDRTGLSLNFAGDLNDNFQVKADIFVTYMEQFDRGVKAAFNGKSSLEAYEVNGVAALENTDQYDAIQNGSQVSQVGTVHFVDEEGNPQARDLFVVEVADVIAPDFSSQSVSFANKTAAINTNWQLDYTNQDNFDASFRLIYSEAEKQNRNAGLQQGKPAWYWEDIDEENGKDPIDPYYVQVDYRGKYPSFSFASDLTDTDLLRKYQAAALGENIDASLGAARFDGTLRLADSNIWESLQFGVRYGVRDATKERFFYVTPTGRYSTWDDPRVPANQRFQLLTGNQLWEKYAEWRDFVYEDEDIRLRNAGLADNGFDRSDTTPYSNFGPFSGFESGVSSLNPATWDDPLVFMNQLYPGTKTAIDPAFAYEVKEESVSTYLQANFANDDGLWGVPFSGNLGLRVVENNRTIQQSDVPSVLDQTNALGYELEPWDQIAFVYGVNEIKHSYTDVLPSANINLFPADDVIVRFGAAKTVSRNDLDNIGSSLSLWYQQCPKTRPDGSQVTVNDGSGNEVGLTVGCVGGGDYKGNPTIKPWEAWVFNNSTEWYFADDSILGIGLFLIQIDTSVETFQEPWRFADSDGIDRGRTANIWTTTNSEASDLYGLELGYKQSFKFLPGEFLSATGVEFNYTYSESESKDFDLNGKPFPLPSNSEHQSNFILWYDKDGLNARIAYNWRSKEYRGRTGLNSNQVPISLGNWAEPTGYLDASINYWVNDHLSVNLNGTNLTDESQRVYAQFENQFQSLWVQERRITAGITLSL